MNEKYEKLGVAIDTIENLTFALKLPLPDSMHIEALKASLPKAVKELKEGFIEATGENPWE